MSRLVPSEKMGSTPRHAEAWRRGNAMQVIGIQVSQSHHTPAKRTAGAYAARSATEAYSPHAFRSKDTKQPQQSPRRYTLLGARRAKDCRMFMVPWQHIVIRRITYA